jgi:hypothetical protein
MVASRDNNGVGGVRVCVWASYSVKVVSKGLGYSSIQPMYQRVDALVQQGGNVVGASGLNYISRWVRQNPVLYFDVFDNVNFFYLGGVYEVMLSAA